MDLGKGIPSFSAACILAVILFASACDSSFEPLQENDQYDFSMYGTLDLYADTQWVRVMPIGETLIPENLESNDVEVTLTRENTGETTVLNDSLFVFGNRAYVWNYWTTMPLHSNEDFILRAEGSDGRSSSVEVTMPSPLPLPLVKYSENTQRATITGSSVEPLVMADTRFYVQVITEVGLAPETEVIFSHLEEMYVDPNNNFRFLIDIPDLIAGELKIRSWEFVMNKKELVIATGSDDWPDLSDLSEEEIVLPDVVSNVENGTGYVAGIASRRVPLKSCYDQEGELTPCQESE